MFFQLTAGGPATGVAFGLAITLWLRYMYNKPLAEISLTVAGAYATYIVADKLFGVSAVLAVVFLGELSTSHALPPHLPMSSVVIVGHSLFGVSAVLFNNE